MKKRPQTHENGMVEDVHVDYEIEKLVNDIINQEITTNFISDRYKIYDIGIKTKDGNKSIGINFHDCYDSDYIEADKMFDLFPWAKQTLITILTKQLQSTIFKKPPLYNSIFMCGVVFDNFKFVGMKAYIRFSLKEYSTLLQRADIAMRILNEISPNCSAREKLADIICKLENVKYIFSFVGVDSYIDKKCRIKLYFRSYNCKKSDKYIFDFLDQFSYGNNIRQLYYQYEGAIEGLALSLNSIGYIDGIQLYIQPEAINLNNESNKKQK